MEGYIGYREGTKDGELDVVGFGTSRACMSHPTAFTWSDEVSDIIIADICGRYCFGNDWTYSRASGKADIFCLTTS